MASATTPRPGIGKVVYRDHLPSRCPSCQQITAMLVRQGKKAADVECMGCGAWWMRYGDFRGGDA